MKIKGILIGVLFLSLALSSFAQEDSKEWKHKLKDLTPDAYKELVENNQDLQKQLAEAKTETDHFRNESTSKDAEIAKLKQDLEAAKASAPSAAINATTTSGESSSVTKTTAKNGLVYKVQIGAFKNKNLEKYLNKNKNFSGDIDADGTRKYTLGEFSDYWEANQFKKYLREMGVKDAWIVSYKNGKRIPIKDALEGV